MSVLVLVVDDEPDVETLFRQQFRRDLRSQRFIMDFASIAGVDEVRIKVTNWAAAIDEKANAEEVVVGHG